MAITAIVRIPDEILPRIDERIFERSKRREHGRAVARTGIMIELRTAATLGSVSNQ